MVLVPQRIVHVRPFAPVVQPPVHALGQPLPVDGGAKPHEATHTPPKQTPLWQSPLPLQVRPLTHLVHVAPPQSTSDSVPFLTRSVQVGAWQTLPVHTPLTQSLPPMQP